MAPKKDNGPSNAVLDERIRNWMDRSTVNYLELKVKLEKLEVIISDKLATKEEVKELAKDIQPGVNFRDDLFKYIFYAVLAAALSWLLYNRR